MTAIDNRAAPRTASDRDQWFAEQSMAWHGWASPVGIGAFLVAAGLAALLVRLAVLGL